MGPKVEVLLAESKGATSLRCNFLDHMEYRPLGDWCALCNILSEQGLDIYRARLTELAQATGHLTPTVLAPTFTPAEVLAEVPPAEGYRLGEITLHIDA